MSAWPFGAAGAAKQIEAERKRLKAPILDLGRQLDDAAGEALAPFFALKGDLGRKLMAYQDAENARRADEARRVAAARAAAEAEARRQQAEADRIREEAAAQQRAAKESAPSDALPWELPAAVAVVVPERTTIIPEYVPPAPAPLKSSAVKRTTVKRLVIENAALIPPMVAGVALWSLDDAAVTKLLRAGIAVPGCHLEETEIIAAK